MSVADFYDLFDKKPDAPRTPGGVVTPIDPERASKYARTALSNECNAVLTAANGTRNDTLNKAAFSIGQLVAAGHVGRVDAWDSLEAAGLAAGLEPNEVHATLTSGLGAGAEQPRIVPDLKPVPEPTVLTAIPTDLDADDLDDIVRRQFPILDWQGLWDTEDEDEEWILEPLLPARRLVALFSAPKVGKSLLMLEIAAAVAQGGTVLGEQVDRPHRVLYIDFENDPRADIRQRLRAMGRKPGDLTNLCYLSYPTLAKLDTSNGAAELMACIKVYDCEVVVIDTISRAVGGEENENDTWLSFYRHTGLAMKQAGVSCIRLDHTGKDHEKGMRGGSAKYGDVDAVWKLSKVTEETLRLDCTDHRMRVGEPTIVVTREVTPTLYHHVHGEGKSAAMNAKVADVIRVLDADDLPNDMGRPGARAHLKAVGYSASSACVEEAVRLRRMRVGTSIQEELP